jgi:hypothetical protein
MSFTPEVKARMFVKCARICCLCFKQCGTNIEAAHIVAEGKGGNEEDNGIPVCFDCHQEIGAYDPKHPLGNKFTMEELKDRRNHLYTLVEKGVLQAQIFAQGLHRSAAKDIPASALTGQHTPGAGAEALCKATLEGKSIEALPLKLKLLSPDDQAYLIDALTNAFEEPFALQSVLSILLQETDKERALVVAEQLLRKVALSGNAYPKAQFMRFAPIDLLKKVDKDLRIAFFTDILIIMEENQFAQVNEVTPTVIKAQDAIPTELEDRYVQALLHQTEGGGYKAAPAARTAIKKLPDNLARALLRSVTMGDLERHWIEQSPLRPAIKQYESLWPEERHELFQDYVTMTPYEFLQKRVWTATEQDF